MSINVGDEILVVESLEIGNEKESGGEGEGEGGHRKRKRD